MIKWNWIQLLVKFLTFGLSKKVNFYGFNFANKNLLFWVLLGINSKIYSQKTFLGHSSLSMPSSDSNVKGFIF